MFTVQQNIAERSSVAVSDMVLGNRNSLNLLDVTFEYNFSSHEQVTALAASESKKFGFLLEPDNTFPPVIVRSLSFSGKAQPRILFAYMGGCFLNYSPHSGCCCSSSSRRRSVTPFRMWRLKELITQTCKYIRNLQKEFRISIEPSTIYEEVIYPIYKQRSITERNDSN